MRTNRRIKNHQVASTASIPLCPSGCPSSSEDGICLKKKVKASPMSLSRSKAAPQSLKCSESEVTEKPSNTSRPLLVIYRSYSKDAGKLKMLRMDSSIECRDIGLSVPAYFGTSENTDESGDSVNSAVSTDDIDVVNIFSHSEHLQHEEHAKNSVGNNSSNKSYLNSEKKEFSPRSILRESRYSQKASKLPFSEKIQPLPIKSDSFHDQKTCSIFDHTEGQTSFYPNKPIKQYMNALFSFLCGSSIS